jgi:hypothetical protein
MKTKNDQKSKNYCRVKIRKPVVKKTKEVIIERSFAERLLDNFFAKRINGPIILNITHVKDYVESDQLKFAAQLKKLEDNVGAYKTKYGLTTVDINEILADSLYFNFYVVKRAGVPDYAKAWTKKGDDMLNGKGDASLWPQGADTSIAPADVPNGIVARYREKVQRMKSQKSIYKVDDGIIMGFDSVHTVFVPGDGKPTPKVSLVNGGHPQLAFIISEYQQVEIQVDRGDGKGMVALDKTKNVHYVDNSTLPEAGVTALWKYQMIYWYADARAGAWSAIMEIAVKGY